MESYIIEEYKNFGKVVKFERNDVILRITLDIGPRIIYYGTKDYNFLKEDVDRDVNKDGPYFDENFKEGECWYLYGGHRLWKSPEDLETYTPDNYPVDYKLTNDGGSFSCHVAHNFDYTMIIQLKNDGSVEIVDKILNKGKEDQEIAVWGLTVMNKGGTAVMRKNTAESDLLPEQNLVTWSYNDLNDERLYQSHKYLTLSQRNIERAIKIGTFNKLGRVSYLLNDDAFNVDFDVVDGNFVDYGCNVEMYTNQHILEVEILSPIYKLKQNESAELIMNWSITKDVKLDKLNDEDLEKIGL